MASQIVGELRRGSGSLSKGENGRLVLTMQVDFLVVSDDKFASREQILLNTENAPVVGIQYGPLLATCISKSVNRKEENPYYWEMTCEFDSSRTEQQPDQNDPNNPNPATWIPVWKLKLSSEDSETMWKDYDPAGEKIIANTAKELLDPLPTKKSTVVSWVFNQFENSSLSLKTISDRHNKINSGAIFGFPQHTLLCQVEDAELGIYNGFYVWNIAYQLAYKEDKWTTKSYSWGDKFLDNGKLSPYLNDKGQQIFGPLGQNGEKALGTDGWFQQFYLIKPASFGFLR